jgi:hypothetical protein
MSSIVAISGTARPGNYTSHALGLVRDELAIRGADVEYFDARDLTLGFPGQPTTEDSKRLAAAVRDADGVVIAEGVCTDAGTEAALRGIAGSLLDFIEDYVKPKYILEEMVREGTGTWTSTV